MVHNEDIRVVQEVAPGMETSSPDAEFRFVVFVSDGERADSPDAKAVDSFKNGASNRHVAADEVSNVGRFGGCAGVRAADHPEKLAGKPDRPPGHPPRNDRAADSEKFWVGREASVDASEPLRCRTGILVNERDDLARRCPDTGVPSAGQSLRGTVRDDANVGEPVHGASEQVVVVIDDQHDLVSRSHLSIQRRNRLDEFVPSGLRVRAHHHSDRRRRRSTAHRSTICFARGGGGRGHERHDADRTAAALRSTAPDPGGSRRPVRWLR